MLHFRGRMAADSNNEDPLYEGLEIQRDDTKPFAIEQMRYIQAAFHM